MIRAIVLSLMVAASSFAQQFTGNARWQNLNVAQLPAAASLNKGVHFNVVDGASATDCSTGSGTTLVECVSNGSSWVAIGTGGGGSGYNLILSNGSAVATQTTLNVIPGTGANAACVNNSGASRTDCTFSTNFAVAQSIAADQNGGSVYCSSTGSATALTCDPGTNVGAASWTSATVANPGPRLFLVSNTQTSGTPTVTVSSQGPYNLKRADCTTAIGGDLQANQGLWFWFNGTNFCELPTPPLPQVLTGANCSSSASPAACGAAAAGSVVIGSGVTSVVVDSSAVTANSQIFVFADDTLGAKLSVTCNSTFSTLAGGLAITARTAGTSFTVQTAATVAVNPLCLSFLIVN